MKYDIFISYRRADVGRETARAIQEKLENLRYKVFLDLNVLKDGTYEERIMAALDSAPVVLFILTPNSLDRCVNEDDWVRKELTTAIKAKKQLIPVNPDNKFKTVPEGIPEEIKNAIETIQHSDIMIGSLFQESINKMVKERIEPYIDRGFWHRNKKKIALSLAAMIVLTASLFSYKYYKEGSIPGEIMTSYRTCLLRAESLMGTTDSLTFSAYYLEKADSIKAGYTNPRQTERFGTGAAELRQRLNDKTDSIFNAYVQQYKFHYGRYLQENSHKDKIQALEYIDKALSIKNDDDLETMKNILTSSAL